MSLEHFVLTETPEEKQDGEVKRLHLARQEFMTDYPRFPTIQTRVAGVSFEGRQSVLSEVASGDALVFERQPHNVYDQNAVKISLLDGRQLGYVPRDMTSHFGEIACVGRVKSVGLGNSGHYGAQVFVQPNLPALLPPFFPPSLSLFTQPFEGYREEQLHKLVQFLKNNGYVSCAVTGMQETLLPCLFWRVHPELKQYELSGVRLIHADLLPVVQMQNVENVYLVRLLTAVNGWTKEEALLYISGCLKRRDEKAHGWTVRSGGLPDMLKKLDLPLPPALKIKSA